MPATTYTATETLPDGRTRVLVTGLTVPQLLAHRFAGPTWAVSWTRDDAPPSAADRAHATLAVWAADATSYNEWHGEAAHTWNRYDEFMRHGRGDDPQAEELCAALLHWAKREDRYSEPHRTAAGVVWTLYALTVPSDAVPVQLPPAAWRGWSE